MSQWYSARIAVPIIAPIGGKSKGTSLVSTAIAKLQVTRPDLAAQLAGVNWSAIVKSVARQAFKEAAKYVKDDTGEAPKGGRILCRGRTVSGDHVGLALKDGQLHIFWFDNSDQGRRTGALKQLMTTFEEAYRKHAIAATLRIIGAGEVETRVEADGAITLSVALKEVG